MPNKDIEVELRGEIKSEDIPRMRRELTKRGFKLETKYRRIMVMNFGFVSSRGDKMKVGKPQWADLRCRMTNGKGEIMCKIGEGHAHNRREISVPVSKKDFLHFAEMFGSMGFFTKVGTREAATYLKGPIQVALVNSPSGLAYFELEIMSDRKNEKKDIAKLRALAKELGLALVFGKKDFFAFCDKLTKRDDWRFTGTAKDLTRLAREIN